MNDMATEDRLWEQLRSERLDRAESALYRELIERGMPEDLARENAREARRECFTFDDDGTVKVGLHSGGTVADRHVYHVTEHVAQEDSGLDAERSVLHPADHCAGCLAEVAKGWRPIGAMVTIGERDSKGECPELRGVPVLRGVPPLGRRSASGVGTPRSG